MKFENTETWGFQHALRGMRNPKNSWNKNDTVVYDEDTTSFDNGENLGNNTPMCVHIGPNDIKLAQTLIKAGPEHRKFLRQIFVSVDITAPLYFFKELDTYKIGTTANSTSTMHKLTSKPITLDCFEVDDMKSDIVYYEEPMFGDIAKNDIGMLADFIIEQLEFLRQKYLETKDKRYWKELVRWLPEGWLQTRTFTCNYEVLRNVMHQRKNHKLKYEWDSFIKWGKTLPYSKELIFYNNGYEKEYELHNLLS